MKTYIRIQHQLFLLSGSLLVLTLMFGIAAILMVQHESRAIQSIYADRVVPLKELKEVADKYAVDIVDAAHKARDGGMTPDQALASIRSAQKTVQKVWTEYKQTSLVDAERALIAQLEPLMRAADAATADMVSLIAANDTEGLRAFAASKMYPVFDPMQGVIGQLIQVQLDVANSVYRQSVSDVRVMVIALASSLAIALVLGLFLAYRVSRGLLSRLGAEPHEVRAAAQASGMAAARDMDPAMEQRLPAEFLRLGMSTHAAWDSLAVDVGRGVSSQQALGRLGTIMNNCVACHTQFRINVQP